MAASCVDAGSTPEGDVLTTRYAREFDAIAELANEALRGAELQRLVLSGARAADDLQRVEIRPVVVRGRCVLNVQRYDREKCLTSNVDSPQEPQIQELLSGFRHLMVQTSRQRTDARLTKRGRTLVSVVDEGKAPDLRHDRQKRTFLAPDAPFLELLGVSSRGAVKPTQQRKWRQVDEFLRLLTSLRPFPRLLEEDPVRIVDLGSGNAYLTFATYHYLQQVLGVNCEMVGVDRDGKAVARASGRARSLRWDGLAFVEGSIADAPLPWRPHVVLSLHACDTATDEAAARALGWESEALMLAPCCHHDIQLQMKGSDRRGWGPVLRQGLLQERLGDVLTDALRTSLIASLGYRTDVVQFVSPEHTAKNLMIRAWRNDAVERERYCQEYESLRDEWRVEPRLELLLRRQAAVGDAGTVSPAVG